MGSQHLTQEDRQRIRTLYYEANTSRRIIQRLVGCTMRQIRTALDADTACPGQRPGRPRRMTAEQEEQLIAYLSTSRETRRMTFQELSSTVFNGIFGLYTIRSTLRRLGYSRCLARQKPPLSASHKQRRVEWAKAHENWTDSDWARVLFTDETWVTGGPHRRQWVTRRPGEEFNDTCLVDRHQRKGGWMLWAGITATGKGPYVFWEKTWGSIKADTYQIVFYPSSMDGFAHKIKRLFSCKIMHPHIRPRPPKHIYKITGLLLWNGRRYPQI